MDAQHALIGYMDQGDSCVLQDLNSSEGTYVNDLRIQGTSVRLSPGDAIRFGGSTVVYEFGVYGQVGQCDEDRGVPLNAEIISSA